MATAKPRQPRRPGRSARGGHTALTPALQRRIVANIKKGTHIEIAARAVGIHRDTFYHWLKQGRPHVDDSGVEVPGVQPYSDFADAIEQAEAELEQDLVSRYRTVSRQAAFGNAAHLAGFLGRRFRGRWDPKQQVEISGPSGGPVKIEGSVDDRLADVLGALARTGRIVIPGREDGAPDEPDAEDTD